MARLGEGTVRPGLRALRNDMPVPVDAQNRHQLDSLYESQISADTRHERWARRRRGSPAGGVVGSASARVTSARLSPGHPHRNSAKKCLASGVATAVRCPWFHSGAGYRRGKSACHGATRER
jgi:hypothetical protein